MVIIGYIYVYTMYHTMWYLSSVMPFYYLGCMLKLIALHSYTMLETKVQFPIEGEKFFGLPIVTNSTHARVMDKKVTEFIQSRRWQRSIIRVLVAPHNSGRSKGVPRRTPLPMDQNFLNFMQFFGKSGKFVCWLPWRVGTPS